MSHCSFLPSRPTSRVLATTVTSILTFWISSPTTALGSINEVEIQDESQQEDKEQLESVGPAHYAVGCRQILPKTQHVSQRLRKKWPYYRNKLIGTDWANWSQAKMESKPCLNGWVSSLIELCRNIHGCRGRMRIFLVLLGRTIFKFSEANEKHWLRISKELYYLKENTAKVYRTAKQCR